MTIFVHEDQTAELADRTGRPIVGRLPMFRLGERLAELGYDPADLTPD